MHNYCFMSIDKIKKIDEMQGKYEHNARIGNVLNADPSKKDQNEVIIAMAEVNMEEAFNNRINSLTYYQKGKKIRSNAVLAIEVLTTFSREAAENVDLDKWKVENVEWLKKTFNANPTLGENIISLIFHNDENGNCHCHAIIITIDAKGSLNYSYYIDGPRMLRNLQDSYAQAMKPFGLERGIKGSVAKHEDIKHFYEALNREIEKELPSVQKKALKRETAEEYRARANEVYKGSNLANLALIKKLERKIVVSKTGAKAELKKSLEEIIKEKEKEGKLTMRARTAEKEIEDLQREFGPMNVIREKLIKQEAIDKGIGEYINIHPELCSKIRELLELLQQIFRWYIDKYKQNMLKEKDEKSHDKDDERVL